ncbi:hypothetical protein, partial [Thiolapillus sp.]|uniref:hypothetical protein n=1 Tax=Thiolapillus sp. TaxID=2017437 RepID=UPI003AF4B263
DAPSVASDMSIDFSCVVKFQEKVCTGSGGENRCGFLGAYDESGSPAPSSRREASRYHRSPGE